jgi:hypothetical protein
MMPTGVVWWLFEREEMNYPVILNRSISDSQQSWRYEDGPWKEPRPPLLVVADYE